MVRLVHAHVHACSYRVWERRAVGGKREKMSKCWGEGKMEEGVGEGRRVRVQRVKGEG